MLRGSGRSTYWVEMASARSLILMVDSNSAQDGRFLDMPAPGAMCCPALGGSLRLGQIAIVKLLR
jgi:hypothetical protein